MDGAPGGIGMGEMVIIFLLLLLLLDAKRGPPKMRGPPRGFV
jgi:Sec-independent protein translocase protein TatA